MQNPALRNLEQLDLEEEKKEGLRIMITSLQRELSELIDEKEAPISLYEASTHILGRGKLLRPLITLLVSEACGAEHDKAMRLALAAELLHMASLIHDDIIDDAETRRGVASVHRKYGIEKAIVAGDLLISIAVKMTADLGSRIIELMSDAARKMSEGEILEMEKKREKINLEEYFDIIKRKTASLIESSTASAAILAGIPEKEVEAYGDYGRLIGLSLQVRDDVLDVIGKEEFVGKPLRKDHIRGHTNIIYVLAQKRGVNPSDHQEIFNQGLIEEAQRIGKELVQGAVNALSFLEKKKRKTFEEIADIIITRMV